MQMEKQDFTTWLKLNLSQWEWERLSKIFGGLSTYKLSRRLGGFSGWKKPELLSFLKYMVDSHQLSLPDGAYEWLRQFNIELDVTIAEMESINEALAKNEGGLHPVYTEFKNIVETA